MAVDDKLLAEVSDLIIRTMDHSVTAEEFERLQFLLTTSAASREYYFDIISTFVGVDEIQSHFGGDEKNAMELLKALSDEEKTSPKIEIPDTELTPQTTVLQQVERPEVRYFDKRHLTQLLTSVAAILAVIISFQFIPDRRSYEVATLSDSLNVEWEKPPFVLEKGSRLSAGTDYFQMQSGFAELQFDNGVRVVIEAPSEFMILNEDQIKLYRGQLYVSVPQEAIGFSVATLNSKIIDLGTEFGVRVESGQSSQLYVTDGKVNLIAGRKDQRFSSLVHQGQAKRVSGLDSEVADIVYDDTKFVRQISSESQTLWRGEKAIDLADIASGGDGFGTALPNMGIDFKSGKLISGNSEQRGKGSKEYILVPELPFVDGVFVPAKGEIAIPLTSAGHTYNEFGSFSGQYYIAVGSYKKVNVYSSAKKQWQYDMPLHLKGYPSDGSVNLCLHANAGITFDLEQIRRSMPFLDIQRFTSLYGVSENAGQTIVSAFYVFVDGQPRLIDRDVSDDNEPGHISIPLASDDRFLTLACMEEDGNYADWTLFVNPQLETEVKD